MADYHDLSESGAQLDAALGKAHDQNTDTGLGAVGTKNPPIDADKAVFRDSEDADALVTSTWSQIKAFLKTYFDTLYNNYSLEAHASNHTDGTDDIQTASTSQKGLLSSTDWDTFNGKADAEVYKTISIPAGAFTPVDTNGAATGTNEYATNDINLDYFAFDATTLEKVQFAFTMPEDWDRSTIKAKFKWSSAADSTAGDTVEWGLKAGALSNDDAIDAALGTGQVISDALLADDGADMQITGATPAITVGGTPALGDTIVFEVYRNVSGTDDMVEDAWLFEVVIQYHTSATTVAAW